MVDVTFCSPDLDSFCLLDRLGLSVTGQHLDSDRAVLRCRVLAADDWCHECGSRGVARDSVTRELAHVPVGWRPTTLQLRVRRYRCTGCGHVWRQDTTAAAAPRAKLSRPAVLWALKSVVIDRLSIARVAAGLAVSWHTVNDAVLTTGRALLIADPARLDGVRVLGVDEHAWRHTHRGDKYVTVIIDLTPVRDRRGPARLLDMVEGRSKQVFTAWLQAQTPAFRAGIEVVAMDGFTGFKTAATEQLPHAVTVMDPFHVVALAGDALDRCRQRVQQDTHGHRGRTGDPLYGVRRILRTGEDLLTDRQLLRLHAVLTDPAHVQVQTTWAVYQQIVAAYRNPDRAAAKTALTAIITTISHAVPAVLTELTTLGRTLHRRAADLLAYFDRHHTSNGPTEAINGRLEHLRGTALGFRNLTNYITRALLDTGGFRPRLHPHLR
jgi:transposase